MYTIQNTLEIIGSDDEIKKVREFIKEDCDDGAYIDFEKIMPIPLEYLKGDKIIFVRKWCFDNWGTYFEPLEQYLISENTIEFLTKDYSARKLIIRLSEMFPMVRFKFDVMIIEELVYSRIGSYCITSYSICDGLYKCFYFNVYGESYEDKSSYYEKIDALIKQYREPINHLVAS